MEKCKREKYLRLFIFTLQYLICTTFILEIPLYAQTQKSWQWVKQLGGVSWDISAGVVSDSNSNLYVTGSFRDTLNCGSKKAVSSGSKDLFIAIFDGGGDLKELTSAGGKDNDVSTCICITSKDNIIIGGALSDTTQFGKVKVSGSGKQIFIAKVDSKGKFVWVATIAVMNDASLSMIEAEKAGGIFISGVFTGTLKAGSQEVTSKGKKDIFIARLSDSGAFEKLSSFGSTEDDFCGSLSVNNLGNVVISGVYGRPFEIGEITLTTGMKETKTNAFIVTFDRNFNTLWANTLYGDDYAQIASLKYDNTGNLFVAGSFSSKLRFRDTILISNGYTDGFILKYKPDGRLGWGRNFGSWYYDYASHLNIDKLGGVIIAGSIGDTLVVDSLTITPVSKDNSALVVQFTSSGQAIWADCISGTGRNFSTGSAIDPQGNLYFTGSFRDKFGKDNASLTSYGDQDVFLAKYFNCTKTRAEITGNLSFCPDMGTVLSVGRGFNNIIWNDTIYGQSRILANREGKYWIRMFDKKGCVLRDTVRVVQNDLPVFSLGNDTSILVTDSLLLRAPDDYSVYRWNDYSSGPEYIAKTVDKKAGTFKYWLTVSNSMSCNYTDTISVIYLKEADGFDPEKVQLFIYPNPASDRISWYLNTNETCQIVVELADSNGRVLYHRFYRQYLPGEVEEIILTSLSSGTYNLRISNSSGGSYKTARVIKK